MKRASLFDMEHDGRGFWDQHARNYDRSMRLLGGPMPGVVERITTATRGLGRVLEVAAGTGLVTLAIAPGVGELVATDYSAAMVGELERRIQRADAPNVRCTQANIYALPFEEGSFDAVVAANVFHLVPDVSGAVDALRRVVKPGGMIFAPTFCHDETLLSRGVSRALAVTRFPGRRRFTTESLRAALEAAGVRVTRIETLSGLIPIGYVEGAAHPA